MAMRLACVQIFKGQKNFQQTFLRLNQSNAVKNPADFVEFRNIPRVKLISIDQAIHYDKLKSRNKPIEISVQCIKKATTRVQMFRFKPRVGLIKHEKKV